VNFRNYLLSLIDSPDRAWLGLLLGLVLIGRELAGPGRVLPGVLGAVVALTSVWAMSSYHFTPAGVLLVGLAVALIVVQGFRRLWFVPGVAGAALMAAGARTLLSAPWSISWPAALCGSAVAALAACLWFVAVRARRNKLSA
jgi:membrane-bound ClpP family serine protease